MNENREQETHSDLRQPAEFSALPSDEAGPVKHSGIGIASTVFGGIALIVWLLALTMIFSGAPQFVNEISVSPTITEEEMAELMLRHPGLFGGALLLLVAGFLSVIGGILGIVSLFQQGRKKLFPVLGTVLNGVPIAVLIVLMASISFLG